ncbi:MAG: glycosyltransferase family 4 protein [Chloroflexi bacterium]|nr:glycosyltransferase family 4 protein [Chloroflexota bacterium]MCI0861854.1 glycosyltransferase family 4 protein [Chloroflexota bacterium]MDK1045290.1 glycosyltransferase family 4 protein [Anaerolineales bacterium]
MRILVLNYEFPPVGGGGGRASAALCAALARRGHELRVITSRAPDLAPEERLEGYRVTRVFTGRRSRYQASFASMAGYVVGALIPALRLARSWKPDVIHAHFAVPTGVLALRLSKMTRTPYVLTAHLGDVPGGVPGKTDRWFRWVYPFTPSVWKNAARVVAVSEHTRGLARENYEVDIDVIPNGIDLRSDGPKSVADPPRLIFAGRFQPQKNLRLLVELLARVQDVPWQCELLGDGPDRAEIIQLVRSYALDARVELPGWVDGDVVERRLNASDLLLLTSRTEGFPVIGVQSLAIGLAILASRAGGLSELVENEVNGRLCEVDDLACFEQALRWCLEDRERLLEMKRASHSKAGRFDIRGIAEKYEEVLQEAAKSEV